MTVEQLALRFLEKRYELNMGAGKLAKRLKVEREDIYKAKVLAKSMITPGNKLPKILIFDIETAPLKGYVWRLWKEDVGPSRMISDWFMLTWSAKWLFDDKVYSGKLKPREVLEENDFRIVKSLWSLVDEADIIIAHNGDRYDVPRLNSRFIVNELPQPSPYQTIDTMKVAKRTFGFSSNKLDMLAQTFGFEGKLGTGFDLWARCMEGDKEALDYMSKYNDQDVLLLEEVYLKLRPWIKSHPNVGLYMEVDNLVCPNCGSSKLEHTHKYYYTQTGKYEVYRCECGALARHRLNAFDKEKKVNLSVGLSR